MNHYKGINYPIMNTYERGLCVVQCTYVPRRHLHCALRPPTNPTSPRSLSGPPDAVYHGPTTSMGVLETDPYADAGSMGIFQETETHRFQDVDAEQIVRRILDKRREYEERQRRKGGKAAGEEAQQRREVMEREKEAERERRAEGGLRGSLVLESLVGSGWRVGAKMRIVYTVIGHYGGRKGQERLGRSRRKFCIGDFWRCWMVREVRAIIGLP